MLVLLFGVIVSSTLKSEASGTFPHRTWYLHGEYETGSYALSLTMNESSPEIHTTDPSVGGQDHIVGSLGFGYYAPLTLSFQLSPSYPYGFDLQSGIGSFELWMFATNITSGNNGFTGATAQFNLTLSNPSGKILGTTTTGIVLPGSAYGLAAWNHTIISFPIPDSYSIPSSSSVNFAIRLMNPSNTYVITFGFNTDVHSSNVSVPANYYSSSLTLSTDSPTGNGSPDSPFMVRLGQTIRLRGSLTNLLNGSGVPTATVTLTPHQLYSWQQSFVLASVSTLATGEYEYDWSPRDASLLGIYGVVASWSGSRYFTANVSQPYTTVSVIKALTTLTIQLGISTAYPGFQVAIDGSLTGLNGPIQGANVVLSFAVPGSDTWTIVTSSQTNSSGVYKATWVPQATGNFTLRASWTGDAVQDVGIATAFLTSLAPPGTGPIWVGSATLVSDLSFNSDTRILSFNLSPPVTAGSTVTIYVPKGVSKLSPNAPLKVGGTLVTYSVQDANSAWLLSFNVPKESSSALQVVLGPLETTAGGSNASAPNLLVLIGLPTVAASTGAIVLLWRRRTRPINKASS